MEIAEYFADNPQIIVNGFVKAGIAGALDGHVDEQERESRMPERMKLTVKSMKVM